MEGAKRHCRTFSPHGSDALQGCTTVHPQAGSYRRPASRASLNKQSRLGRRLHEVVGEDGGRPVRRFPHPQYYPQKHTDSGLPWSLCTHSAGTYWQLVPSSTQGPSSPLLIGVSGGLVQDQCVIGDINIAFLSQSSIVSLLDRPPSRLAGIVVVDH